ncbi:efflux RND transporter periplasmic adaptor subunit [soil metagenome]
MLKKSLIGIALVIVVITTVVWSMHGRAENKDIVVPTVAVARAGLSDLAQTISVTGEMRPNQQIDLHAKVAGFLQSINVDIGDHVKEGEVIAVLEIPELKEDVNSAKAATAAAQEEVNSSEAKYQEVHLSLQRLQEVAKKNPKLIAQQDLDNANSRDLAAKADLALATQRVAESEANQERVETMARYATITAPFDGVITKRYADPGSLIQAGISSSTQAMPVVSLAQDSTLRAVFPLPESVVARLKVGDTVTIQIPALDKSVTGKVSRFARQVDRATRTMEVQIDVPNPGLAITGGMYAVADFAIEHRSQVLNVPVQALKPGADPALFVVNDKMQVERRRVSIGLETPDLVEIKQGLKPGESVIIGNTGELRDGMRVAPKILDVAGTAATRSRNNG